MKFCEYEESFELILVTRGKQLQFDWLFTGISFVTFYCIIFCYSLNNENHMAGAFLLCMYGLYAL